VNEKTPRENAGRMAGLLREQLTDMVAAAYELGDVLRESEKGKKYLSVINRRLCQQLRMVRRLELEHKLTSEDEIRIVLHPVDVSLMCRELMEEVEGLVCGLGIKVAFSEPAKPIVVCADRNRLEDMLLSLISNSARAIGRDGEIELTLERKDGRVIFCLTDNGGGATPDAMAGFFGHAEEESEIPEDPTLGLGLPLARRIAALHNGFVLADNYEGKGMRMVVSISDDLPDMGGGRTLRGSRPHIDEGGWSKAMVELSDCLPISVFEPEEFNA